MKILFFGDSITDMGRNRTPGGNASDYGVGYVFFVAGDLTGRDEEYEVVNRGVSGDRIVSLYMRAKPDVWAETPDVLSVLIGINDIWHDLDGLNMGVEPDRFEKVYRMFLEETLERLPGVKIVLMEPFVEPGAATEFNHEGFLAVKKYAQIVKSLAEEFGLFFLPLQEKFDEAAKKGRGERFLADGVHPNAAGAKLIADEWLKLFDREISR